MNMNRGIAMRKFKSAGWAVIFFGALVFFASDALAQSCTPVVYAFRHAEDTNPAPGQFSLTPTGKAHAALYPSMVNDLQGTPNNFCKVTRVYAATKAAKINCKSNCASATNSFYTAKPLACWAGSNYDLTKCNCWLRSKNKAEADACQNAMTPDPATKATYELYEYLGNGNDPKDFPNPVSYTTKEATALRTELLATAKRNESSAIFWTSQGLHILGGAIIKGTSIVPDKNGTPKVVPPRNAVYVFQFVPDTGPDGGHFRDTPIRADLYVQGYNRGEPSGKFPTPQFIPANKDGTQDYYAGYEPNVLGGTLDDRACPVGDPCGSNIPTAQLEMVKGKICNTTAPMIVPGGGGYYGACQGQ